MPETILDELSYNSEMLSPFLQVSISCFYLNILLGQSWFCRHLLNHFIDVIVLRLELENSSNCRHVWSMKTMKMIKNNFIYYYSSLFKSRFDLYQQSIKRLTTWIQASNMYVITLQFYAILVLLINKRNNSINLKCLLYLKVGNLKVPNTLFCSWHCLITF